MKCTLFSKKQQPDPEMDRLKSELYQAQDDLQQAYHHLNLVADPELVEACIYQINSIQARCNYLIRTIKTHHNLSITASAEEGVTWT